MSDMPRVIHEPVEAGLSIELNVECPHCDNYFDLIKDTNENDEGELFSQACPSGNWTDSHEKFELNIACPRCSNEINIKGIGW